MFSDVVLQLAYFFILLLQLRLYRSIKEPLLIFQLLDFLRHPLYIQLQVIQHLALLTYFCFVFFIEFGQVAVFGLE